jgi:hypothetical protein
MVNIFDMIREENKTLSSPDASVFTVPLAQYQYQLSASKNQTEIDWFVF